MRKSILLLVLAALFAACTPESLNTAFTLTGASGNITVSVFHLNGTAYTGEFIVSGYDALPGSSIAYAPGQAVISFQADEGKAIEQTSLTLVVRGPAIYKDKSIKVVVPQIFAGGHAELVAEAVIGEFVDAYYFDIDADYSDEPWYEYNYLHNAHYTSYQYSHMAYEEYFDEDIPILTWYVNDSDQYLTGTVEIEDAYGTYGGDVEVLTEVVGFESQIADFALHIQKDHIIYYEDTYEFFVSAWAMWNVVMTHEYWPETYTLTAYPIVGTDVDWDHGIPLATGVRTDFDFDYEVFELPYPGMPAHAHYEYGHGHGHGGDNAGGGIVEAE